MGHRITELAEMLRADARYRPSRNRSTHFTGAEVGTTIVAEANRVEHCAAKMREVLIPDELQEELTAPSTSWLL